MSSHVATDSLDGEYRPPDHTGSNEERVAAIFGVNEHGVGVKCREALGVRGRGR